MLQARKSRYEFEFSADHWAPGGSLVSGPTYQSSSLWSSAQSRPGVSRLLRKLIQTHVLIPSELFSKHTFTSESSFPMWKIFQQGRGRKLFFLSKAGIYWTIFPPRVNVYLSCSHYSLYFGLIQFYKT